MTAITIELPREVSTFRGINLSAPAFKARTELAKHGDVEATDSIIETVLKPERVAQLKEIYKDPENIVWVPMSALVDGENILPFTFAKVLEQEVGGKVVEAIKVRTRRPLPHRFIKKGDIRLAREARVDFEVREDTAKLLKDKIVILVDDQFKTGGTVRDAITSLAEEGIKVSEVQTLGAGRSIEFAPEREVLKTSIEALGPERIRVVGEQTGISKNNLTNAELSSINRIAKETKTLEGFEHGLQRINQEYQEAGRRYRLELGETRCSITEGHERIKVAEKEPKEVILPQNPSQELPQEIKESKYEYKPVSLKGISHEGGEAKEDAPTAKPIEKNSAYILITARRVAYFQEMEDRDKAQAEREISPEKKAMWLQHAEDMRKEKASCKMVVDAALEKKETVATVIKEKFIQVRKAELDRLEELKFSFKAKFMDEKIVVLGAADDFEPYKTAAKGKRDLTQLMVRRPDGSRAIMMASQIHVAGKPLLTPTPQGLFPPTWKPPGTKTEAAKEGAIPKEVEPFKKGAGKIQREVSNLLS